jgi:malonyl-CoA O-methyltransferase
MDPDFTLDHHLVRRRFGRAASRNARADPLAREVARRMDERLDYIRIEPRRILDLGCGTGTDQESLARRYPSAQRILADFALPALVRALPERKLLGSLFFRSRRPAALCADAQALPLATGSVSLVWSNLMLNWLSDPMPALTEAHRVLETGGLLMFSTLGPDTLRQLREAFGDMAGRRVHRFIDMHDIGDALVRAGFSDPVMDMDMLTITYRDVDALFEDLRLTGSNNASRSRPRGLSGRAEWTALRTRLEGLRQADGLSISFEIVQGHAWKAEPRKSPDGRDIIRFSPRGTAR